MTDSRYDLDSLLEEIRKKKEELGSMGGPVRPFSTSDAVKNDPFTADHGSTVPEKTAEDDIEALVYGEEDSILGSFTDELITQDLMQTGPAEEQNETDQTDETADDLGSDQIPSSEEENVSRRTLRSISRQLTGSFDIVPDDYTGEFIIGHPDAVREEEPAEEIDFSRSGVEEHPLFTERTASFNVIPKLDDDLRTDEFDVTEEYTRGELRLDEEKMASATQGIINIKESMDDNFRELFGDTVIVEHTDTRRHSRRRERVQENEYSESSETDYEREENPDEVYEELNRRSSSSVFSFVASAVAVILMIAFSYIGHMKGTGTDRTGSIIIAACLFAEIVINWKTVFRGIAGMVTLKPELTSLVGFSALLSLAEPIVCIVTDSYPQSSYSAAIASFALLMSGLGDMLKATRDLKNFRSVSENPQKYASNVITDKSFVQMLTNDLSDNSTGVLISRRTGYTDRFAAYCDTDNIDFIKTRKAQPFVALAIVLLGVLSFFIKGLTASEAVRVAALAAAISAPFMSSLMFELPIHKLQNRLNRLGAVVPGYEAAEDVASANCVVLEGRELFPREKVLLHGIKTFEKERIDQAILYAASVLIHSCDTMSHMFMKVIQGKTDMLFDTDSVVYEEGLGFSFWVDQNRILVGRREMLESHEIEVPSRDYENRYTKASTRDAIYLAVAGKLYAMFVIGYSPDEEMTNLLHGLVKNDISIIVRTRDFIISPEKISRMYDIPQSMITMVRDSSMQELAKKTEYTKHSPSCLTHVGSVGAFLRGMIGCNDLIGSAGLSSILGLAGMGVGIVLAAVLAMVGGLDTVKITSVALFQLIWTVIHIIAILIR